MIRHGFGLAFAIKERCQVVTYFAVRAHMCVCMHLHIDVCTTVYMLTPGTDQVRPILRDRAHTSKTKLCTLVHLFIREHMHVCMCVYMEQSKSDLF